jgi:predicted DNA-binding transcriptional regulator YafY
MRASRLLSILTTLQAKGRVTAQALASEHEVSLRTIYRDVDALSASGVPVYSERGSEGGYRLLDGYRTRLNGLSAMEAESLFLAGFTQQVNELGVGAIAASARNKLLAALPESMRSNAERMRDRFHLDTPAWFEEGESVALLPLVADSVWNERRIKMHYRSGDAIAERRVDPLGIVLKSGVWYLVARESRGIRTFRLSRIADLDVLSESFARPKDFDLAAHWMASIRKFEAEHFPHRAVVRLSPRGVGMMEAFLPAFVRAGAEIAAQADVRGWRVVSLPIGPPAEAACEFLRFGLEIEVLKPAALRLSVAELIDGLQAIYASGVQPTSG